MLGIRQKLILGFGGLFLLVGGIGLLTMTKISVLGRSIDVILRENYKSVIACQSMKEALERIDSGVLFSFMGRPDESRRLVDDNRKVFASALDKELNNITLSGEGETAGKIPALYAAYAESIAAVVDASRPLEERRALYLDDLYPRFLELKSLAQQILDLNQANMVEANDRARAQAATAHRQLLLVILAAAAVALIYSLSIRRWILWPIRRLTVFADEARRGNLDLVLQPKGRDEIGRLAEAFNDMAEGLRRLRRQDRLEIQRTRRATEEVFKALPTPIAVLDLDGRVELATDPADRLFGLKPGADARALGEGWLNGLIDRALAENRPAEPKVRGEDFLQRFDGLRERLFHPVVLPLSTGGGPEEPSGLAVLLLDVTDLHEQLELKRSVVATVSHQLKTPLTALRMSLHMLLDESLGDLNPKQAELALAARDESERLVRIVNDLLDIDRIESGRAQMTFRPTDPVSLIRDAADRHFSEAKDRGIALAASAPPDLPRVLADRSRIALVFDNLLSNAFRYTEAGGSIHIEAESDPAGVRFRVRDTGRGISPEYLDKIFSPFFRAPGQDPASGVGLGLAIVRETIRHHGGEVGVESEPGQGTLFWFTLPKTGGEADGPKVEEVRP
ncbi:MAG: ATP-binding protein [Acidobacteriota bacterium]|nr:ATP-binding protein [Acidobacteriota bacterium]